MTTKKKGDVLVEMRDIRIDGFSDERWHQIIKGVDLTLHRGEVMGLWRQIAPFTRPDGSPYEIAGVGGSWFRYGGDYKWEWQRDFFDLGDETRVTMSTPPEVKF